MAPERGLPPSITILEEAESITTDLLTVQADVEITARLRQIELLQGMRERRGYDPAPVVDESDLSDVRITGKTPVIAPGPLAGLLPITPESAETTRDSRKAVTDILRGEDDRLAVVVGPCSIHDPEAALEYSRHVKRWRTLYGADVEVVMRAYMEKPRTERGWKGFVYDPRLDESDDINLGVVAMRLVASQITNGGVPIAMERLNALTPQYVNGLVTYDAIGARNTTDQKAREYGSGTSSPVGYKNTPEGSIMAAAEAVVSANGPHAFLGMDLNGTLTQINTAGNPAAHVILRGDSRGPNYSAKHIELVTRLLAKKGLLGAIVIDASHGNSFKQADRQAEVLLDVGTQLAGGSVAIRGVMLESNLVAGAQKLIKGRKNELVYGQSITDECIGLDQTETLLASLAQAVQKRREVVYI